MKMESKKILSVFLAALMFLTVWSFSVSAENTCSHVFTNYVYDGNATCVADGTKTAICDKCHLETDTVADPDHPKTGHTEEIIPAVSATCSQTGLTEGKRCSVCGVVLVEQTVVPTIAHIYSDELYTVVDSTCVSTGVKARKCTVCGAFEQDNQEIIAMKEHSYVWTITKKATCAENGSKKGTCEFCKKQITEVIPATDHVLGEWVQTKAPTCSEYGTETAICTVCGAHKERNVEKTEHDVRVLEYVAPTCEKGGLTEGAICFRCKEILVKQEIIMPLGHDYYTVVDIQAPTCTKTGSGHIYCKNDPDYSEWVQIPAIPHVDNDGDDLCDECGAKVSCDCFCHNDTLISRIVRYINTLLSKLLGKNFRCCEDMAPYEGI